MSPCDLRDDYTLYWLLASLLGMLACFIPSSLSLSLFLSLSLSLSLSIHLQSRLKVHFFMANYSKSLVERPSSVSSISWTIIYPLQQEDIGIYTPTVFSDCRRLPRTPVMDRKSTMNSLKNTMNQCRNLFIFLLVPPALHFAAVILM